MTLLIPLYKELSDKSYAQIAKDFGVSYTTLLYWARNFECPDKEVERRITRALPEKLKELRFFFLPGWVPQTMAKIIIEILAESFRISCQRNNFFFAEHGQEVDFATVINALMDKGDHDDAGKDGETGN